MKRITAVELQVKLAQVRTATFATITTVTEPQMKKTGNPYLGRIRKKQTMNVVINFDYANSVNNQLKKEDKEATFVPHARKWGERIQGTCLIQHKGQVYLEAKPNGKPSASEYLFDGEPIEKAKIALYLPKENSNADHQGVEKEIIIRDFKLSSIAEIKLQGEQYEII